MPQSFHLYNEGLGGRDQQAFLVLRIIFLFLGQKKRSAGEDKDKGRLEEFSGGSEQI